MSFTWKTVIDKSNLGKYIEPLDESNFGQICWTTWILMDHTSMTSEKFRIFPIFAAILNFSGNEKCHHLKS